MALYGAWKRYGKHRHRVVAYVKSRIKRFQMIKPTTSRKVWFYTNGQDLIKSHPVSADEPVRHIVAVDESQPLDATIAYVWSDTMVNLRVTDQNGNDYAVTSVLFVQADEAKPPRGQCFATWMPYQVGQAKLAPDVSKALNDANAAATAPAGTMVPSTEPARLQNNVEAPNGDNQMRHEYRILTPAEKQAVKDLKDQGLTLLQLIQSIGHSDELVAAQRYARQAVMWAVAHVTK